MEKLYLDSRAEWGEERTHRYIRDIQKTFATIAENPMLGHSAASIKPDLRLIRVVSHVIFYRPVPEGIVVVRVLHKRMDFLRHL